MSNDIDQSIKQEFLMEAHEMLEDCETSFIELEKTPEDKGILDTIFRLAHTIKGSGYAAGFDHLAEFAHSFEALLSKLRSGEMIADESVIDVLLRSNDTLKAYVNALSEDFTNRIDTSDIEKDLKSFLGDEGQVKPANAEGFGFFDDEESNDIGANTSPADSKPKVIDMKVSWNNAFTLNRTPKALICDDEPEILALISTILEGVGLEILTAGDGKDALQTMKIHSPDVIVTDFKMPNLDGIEFIKEVRNHDKNIPVIFVSGYAEVDQLKEFLKLGTFAFIEKPFSPTLLINTIVNALRFKIIRDTTVQLSSLNFKTYMTISKLLGVLKSPDDEKSESAREKVETYLDEISRLTNFILDPEKKDRAS